MCPLAVDCVAFSGWKTILHFAINAIQLYQQQSDQETMPWRKLRDCGNETFKCSLEIAKNINSSLLHIILDSTVISLLLKYTASYNEVLESTYALLMMKTSYYYIIIPIYVHISIIDFLTY